MSDRPDSSVESGSKNPLILSFEKTTLADLRKINNGRETASDIPQAFSPRPGDALVLLLRAGGGQPEPKETDEKKEAPKKLDEKEIKDLLAKLGEADKKAKPAFEKRDGQDWPTAAKYYGEEVEILEKLYGQFPDNANVKSGYMKALRRFSTSAAHLSQAKEVPDWKEAPDEKTGKYPSAKTPERDREIRDELRDLADKRFSKLWDLIKDEKGKEGDKSTVLLEWGENDLFRAQAKDAAGKSKDAKEIYAAAQKHFQDALDQHRALPKDKQVGDYQVRTLSLLSVSEFKQGKFEDGWKHQAESIKVLQEMAKLDDDTLFKKEDLKRPELGRKLATLQYDLAMSKSMMGKPATAEFDACLSTMKEYGVQPVIDVGGEILTPAANRAEVLRQKAANYITSSPDKPDYAKAKETFDEALKDLKELKEPKPEDLRRQALVLSDRGICFMALGQPKEAVKDLQESLALEKKAGVPAQTLLTVGRLVGALQLRGDKGDVDEAKATYRQYLSILQKQDPKTFEKMVADYKKDHPKLKDASTEDIIRSIAETDLPKPPFKKD